MLLVQKICSLSLQSCATFKALFSRLKVNKVFDKDPIHKYYARSPPNRVSGIIFQDIDVQYGVNKLTLPLRGDASRVIGKNAMFFALHC